MITGTTELAIRALILLVQRDGGGPLPPTRMAESLQCSPTYLGKTLNLLVKADVLRSVRGARGGVFLAHPPDQISLLSIVEAVQGAILGDFCTEVGPQKLRSTCRYHQVMAELHASTIAILSSCFLSQLAEHSGPRGPGNKEIPCKLKPPHIA